MRLTHPFQISARLLPALRIGDRSWLSWSWADYRFYLDTPGFEYEITDFRAGPGSGTQEVFESILAFMEAAAESREYRIRTGTEAENEDLFPPHIVDWIMDNKSEIEMLRYDLEEKMDLIEEAT
jgi:hypothetical protein